MAAAKPYYTSSTLIDAVKRSILIPIAQETFSPDDLLAFANSEMQISQVPSILQFHEEYFVFSEKRNLRPNTNRYKIPNRAIGMRLRDLFYCDNQGNLFEMTRISSEDKALFQRSGVGNQSAYAYYLEGNDVVLSPSISSSVNGSLYFYYFLRPNQLVLDERASIIESFSTTITVDNTGLTAGDYCSIAQNVFTAVVSGAGANQFNIGVDSIATATNLVSAINAADIDVVASNTSGTTATITLSFTDINTALILTDSNIFETTIANITSSNSTSLAIPSTLMITCEDVIDSDVFANSDLIDFLETDCGHKTKAIDKSIINIGGSDFTVSLLDVPISILVGDYICLAGECIIPQIPTDLHTSLVERVCSRILSAMGDQQGLSASKDKLQEIEVRQGSLVDNRVEGSNLKITNRHSLLHSGKRRPGRW